MWKEKESSGTRTMVRLVQVEKEGGWRQSGRHWATFESVLLKWLWLFSFFFFIVNARGRLAQFRAMFPARGSWLQGKILFLSTFHRACVKK